jgi:hypothetical protein
MYTYVAFALSALTAIFWERGVKEFTAERCLNCLDPFLEPGRNLPSENPSRQKVAGSIGTRSQARPDNLPRWRREPKSAQLEVTGTGEPDSGRKRPAAIRRNKRRLQKMRGSQISEVRYRVARSDSCARLLFRVSARIDTVASRKGRGTQSLRNLMAR